MLKQTLWTSNVHNNLKQLPIPLTGHCALMINNDLGKFSKSHLKYWLICNVRPYNWRWD